MSQVRQNNFDFIRFAAATMVWYYHCYALTGKGDDPFTRTVAFESFGGLGVSIFFIVSGYLITASYENHGRLLPFLRNRFLRVMPALIVVVLLSICLLGPLATTLPFNAYAQDPQTRNYFKNMLIFPLQYELPGVFQTHVNQAVNGSLWTLQQEVRCYLVIALLGVLGILQPRVMIALFCTFGAFLIYAAVMGKNPPEKFMTVKWAKLETAIHLGFLFIGGGLIYMFKSLIPRHVGFLTGCLLLMIFSTKFPDLWGRLIFDVSLIYTVIYLGFLRLPLLPQFGRYGDFSYGMYIYSFPVQQLTLHYMHNNMSAFSTFMLASFTATLICAIASWHFIEKPALRWKV